MAEEPTSPRLTNVVIRTVSVCSGIGGLDLGIKFADSRIRTICYVEREAYAAAVLVARMEEQVLDSAPIWDDFTTLRGEGFRGRVDLVVGGIPCQPYSVAGKQKGADDERDLWGTMARFLCESGRPSLFLENVAAFVSGALDRVLWALAEMGYSAEWGVFSNESLGAPHRRERIFLLAWVENSAIQRLQGRNREGSPESRFASSGLELADFDNLKCSGRRRQAKEWVCDTKACINGQELADSEEQRFDENSLPGRNEEELSNAWCRGNKLANSSRESFWRCGHDVSRSRQEQIERYASHCSDFFWPPGQSPDLWRGWSEQYWPAVKRPVRGEADGVPAWLEFANQDRTERLKALGNAVSPPVAAVAWRVLYGRAFGGELDV